MKEKEQQIIALLERAGEAHHEAYREVDGADPDWPIWYADYLVDTLPQLLEAELTRSELVYLLIRMNKEMALKAPGAYWPRYYARYLVNHYLSYAK